MITPNPQQDAVAIDYVVDGPRTAAAVAHGQARLVGMSYARPGEEPRFVDKDLATTLQNLGNRPRAYHDSIFCCAVELQNNLPLPASFDDTRIMLHLLEEDPPSALGDNKPGRGTTTGRLADASLARVRSVNSLYPQLVARIHAEALDNVYRQVEIPVVAPTLAMALAGLHVNTTTLNQIAESHSTQMEIARRQFKELAGREINLDVPEDVAGYLFNDLGLPVPAYNRRGDPSTKEVALQRLVGAHPAVDAFLKYKEAKPIANAAAALLARAEPSSGQVRAELDPLGGVTGRFSCSHPNLQGIPSQVLAAIEATPGHVLMEADISQCELRVLAHFSQDVRLLEAYATTDVDVHRQTAAAVLGLREEQVSDEQRNVVGKKVNFAVIYGMTAEGLSDALGISLGEAERILGAYFAAYPGVEQWVASIHEFVRAHGHVRTLSGRRRQLPDVRSADLGLSGRGLRQAVNTIVQGTAADIIKLALVRLHNVLPPEVRMLTTCHDSVLLEVPELIVDNKECETIAAMSAGLPGFNVPIRVDVGAGKTWADCKEQS